MGWIRMEDNWFRHPKFLGIGGDAAFMFWVLVGWCNEFMTDGRYTALQATQLGVSLGLTKPQINRALARLKDRNLVTLDGVEYRIKGFLKRHGTRVTRQKAIAKARKQTRLRVRRLRSVRSNADVTPVTPEGVPTSPSTSLPSSNGTEKRRRSVLKRREGWPVGLELTEVMAAYARKFRCQSPGLAFDAFRDRSLATGAQYIDWQAAWRNWCRNHDRFGCPCQSVPATPRPRKYFSARSQEEKYARQEQRSLAAAPSPGHAPEPIGEVLLATLQSAQSKAKTT